ncbi:MAG: DUF3575 domain-containing protein [Gammaproteobacteria bacterium]|nr:DUF3575 domain-containing protein [Gammaproteobacteria bacterium]
MKKGWVIQQDTRFFCSISLAFILISGLVLPRAQAVGFGMDFGTSTENWDQTHGSNDRSTMHFGALFDSTVAKQRSFVYRAVLAHELNSYDQYGLQFTGTTMVHSFGLTLMQNRHVRLWLGPHVKYTAYNSIEQPGMFYDYEYDGFIRGYGGGLTMGCNLNLGKLITLGFSGGNRYMRYEGHYKPIYNPYYNYEAREVNADVSSTFFSVSLIFRVNDQF